MSKIILSLGSNMGNRIENLQLAINALNFAPNFEVKQLSNIYVTDPVGGPEQDDYLNMIVIAETGIEPLALLRLCHEIEAMADRERTVHWGPRTLDIDIVAIEENKISDLQLEVPHPRAHERAFVLVPLNDLDPDFNLVGYGKVRDLRAQVDDSGVRFFAEAPSDLSTMHDETFDLLS